MSLYAFVVYRQRFSEPVRYDNTDFSTIVVKFPTVVYQLSLNKLQLNMDFYYLTGSDPCRWVIMIAKALGDQLNKKV